MGMELLLLQVAAFLRPLLFIEIGQTNLFDLGAIAIFCLLALAFLSNIALSNTTQRRSVSFSIVDLAIFAFIFWCLSIYLIYMDVASFRETAKLIIPLAMYTIGKNIIQSREQYLRVLVVMGVGFLLPVVASAVMTALGKGVEFTNYWTGAPRYEGVYAGGHSLGHNMTFFLMLLTTYVVLSFESKQDGARLKPGPALRVALATLALVALYCLAMSRVRTAILGLAVFLAVLLWKFNKKLFFFGGVAGLLVLFVLRPIVVPFLFPDLVMVEKGRGDVSDLASGRPQFWAENLSMFGSLPIDKKIAGAGIGIRKGGQVDAPGDSHNDYLEVLIQTGIVGLALFVALQLLLLKTIWKIPGRERYVFIGMWAAVFIMNFISNSYVSRFGLAQMLYLVLVYSELPDRQRTVTASAETIPVPELEPKFGRPEYPVRSRQTESRGQSYR